ncbi:MAG: hypothetical protein KAR21_14805, partial [Spirochaetales bacterium]|nr:hypothetical protein [Spirochaetales bacterium]
MERDQLFSVVDLILNNSTDEDIEVIMEAIKRRAKGRNTGTFRGINPERLAKETAFTLNKQMSYSVEGVRKMIQEFAVGVIQKEAPELTAEQIQELLEAWVPDPSKRNVKSNSNPLPRDVQLTMIRQILAFSAGTMSASEQTELYNNIPDWQREYWRRLPDGVRDVLTLFLKGSIDEEECWEKVYSV